MKYVIVFTSSYPSKSIKVGTVILGKNLLMVFLIWIIDLGYTSEQHCCYDLFLSR